MTGTKRFICCLLAALFLLALCPLGAFAAVDDIAVSAKTSLGIRYLYEGSPIPGAKFKVYRIADTDSKANFTLTGAYAAYPVSVEDKTVDEWNELAETMAAYVSANGETPDISGTTNGNGELSFDSLKTGLYLVTVEKTVHGKYTYTAKPSIVCLPGFDSETGAWEYDVVVYPKPRQDDITNETVKREVHKIWDDNGDKTNRPKSITVQLYADGEKYGEPVKLTAENSWSYTWNPLPAYDSNGGKIVWTVTEEKLAGYTVKIAQQGVTITITNTKNSPPPENPPKLPQTGMLWWPVPALLFAGTLSVGLGLARRRRDEE